MWASSLPSGLLLQGGYAFAAMLVGLLAARAQVPRSGGGLAPTQLLTWGFGFGLPMQALSGWVAIANNLGSGPSEAIAVGGILWLLERRPAWVTRLRYPGQMSLSTYLLQSTVLATLFGAWGFGLFQSLPYAAAVLVAILTTVALAGFARILLPRTHRGTIEWLLGAWTRAWSRETG